MVDAARWGRGDRGKAGEGGGWRRVPGWQWGELASSANNLWEQKGTGSVPPLSGPTAHGWAAHPTAIVEADASVTLSRLERSTRGVTGAAAETDAHIVLVGRGGCKSRKA